jgi:hypothetical protein
MPANGQFTGADLAPIAGGGYLAKAPAAAWNAMAAEIQKETGTRIAVTGPDSAYRTYARQVYYWNLYLSGQGNLAARPGTSNHGLGMAVDVPTYVRDLIVKYGGPFGWDHGCSDAPGEWWHHKWCGGWNGADPGSAGVVKDKYPTLRKGDDGAAVKRAQTHLARWNLGVTRPKPDGGFGDNTAKAVREFQAIHDLHSDGVIGKKTWLVLRRNDHFTQKERTNINRFELEREKKNPDTTEFRKFFARAAVALITNKNAPHRNERHDKLRKLAGEDLYQQMKKEKNR